MPGIMEYHNGDAVMLRVKVVDARDKGGIVIDIGGAHVSVNHRNLDAADARPASFRPLTPEEEADLERARAASAARQAVATSAAAARAAARSAKEKVAQATGGQGPAPQAV